MHELLTGRKCSGLTIFYLKQYKDKTYWQEIACTYMKSTVKDLLKDKKTKDLEKIP
jgi:hypothetical protein